MLILYIWARIELEIPLAVEVKFQKLLYIILFSTILEFYIVGNPPRENP